MVPCSARIVLAPFDLDDYLSPEWAEINLPMVIADPHTAPILLPRFITHRVRYPSTVALDLHIRGIAHRAAAFVRAPLNGG